MSSEATGWTYRHSPFKGAEFQVHLAIADSVNDQHDQELWMSQGSLAAKARVNRVTANRALMTLIELGFVELIKQQPRGKANRYRFLFPSVAVVYESRRRVAKDNTEVSPLATPPVASDNTEVSPLATQNPSKNPSDPKREPTPMSPASQDDGFAAFWEEYPRRNGKKLDKAKAHSVWKRLNNAERDRARLGVGHYRAACDGGLTLARDAHRWLRDKAFDDWQEPARPEPRKPPDRHAEQAERLLQGEEVGANGQQSRGFAGEARRGLPPGTRT